MPGCRRAVIQLTMTATIGSVLSGAVFGDHCSPISDTTIMSSMSCGADHVDHVRTQLPYAVVVGVVAILCGYLPAGLGLFSPYLGLLLTMAVLWLVLRLFGRKSPELEPETFPVISPSAPPAPEHLGG